ncbi:MAG: ribosome-associated translation inhibitor RaiA [Polaribacter sp.]|jgi:ribosome-associated translation inhibitor RaiA
MKIDIQFVNIPTSETMEAYILEKSQRLFKVYEAIIGVNVFIKK